MKRVTRIDRADPPPPSGGEVDVVDVRPDSARGAGDGASARARMRAAGELVMDKHDAILAKLAK